MIKSANIASKLLSNRTVTRTIRKKVVGLFGASAGGALTTAFTIAMRVAGTSIGNMVAKGLDCADGKRNGYVFG